MDFICGSRLRGTLRCPRCAGTTERKKPGNAKFGGRSMKNLIKQYLDKGISRRKLMTGLSALGMSSVAVKAMAQSLSTTAPASAMREVQGSGGALFVQQLKSAGVEYIEAMNAVTPRWLSFACLLACWLAGSLGTSASHAQTYEPDPKLPPAIQMHGRCAARAGREACWGFAVRPGISAYREPDASSPIVSHYPVGSYI